MSVLLFFFLRSRPRDEPKKYKSLTRLWIMAFEGMFVFLTKSKDERVFILFFISVLSSLVIIRFYIVPVICMFQVLCMLYIYWDYLCFLMYRLSFFLTQFNLFRILDLFFVVLKAWFIYIIVLIKNNINFFTSSSTGEFSKQYYTIFVQHYRIYLRTILSLF